MANNRLYFCCKRSGKKLLLAKYSPGSGWHVHHDDLVERLSALLHENDFGDMSIFEALRRQIPAAGVESEYEDYGAHCLEYEIGPPDQIA